VRPGPAAVLQSRALLVGGVFAWVAALVAAGCNSNSTPADLGGSASSSSGGISSSGSGSGSSSGGGVDASPVDTGTTDGGAESAPMDAMADVPTVPETGSNFDAAVFGDVAIGPPTDATQDVTPGDASKGNGNVCASLLGWWTVGATLDPSVVSASAVSALNPLLTNQNPLTLADTFEDAAAGDAGPPWMVISGTETNGVSQQYFPFAYPTSPAALVQAAGATNPVFTATSPAGQPSTGWIRLLDSTQAEVWIALTNISATLTAGDPLCQSLSSGEVDAVIPSSAGTTTMVLSSGSTTVAAVFGATTSTSPEGWNIRLSFSGQKVQVTFK
jgi:hypothetical protein